MRLYYACANGTNENIPRGLDTPTQILRYRPSKCGPAFSGQLQNVFLLLLQLLNAGIRNPGSVQCTRHTSVYAGLVVISNNVDVQEPLGTLT